MIVTLHIGGTNVSADILYDSVRVKFLTEDDEHYFGISGVTLELDNIDGVRNDMLTSKGRTGTLTMLGYHLMNVVVDTVNANPDEQTIELSLMSQDRKVLDDLKTLKILDFAQDYQGLWTKFEGAAEYRVWTRVDLILERALQSLGIDLEWDLRSLGTSHLVMGGLSPSMALGVTPPELIYDYAGIRIYRQQLPIVPDWTVAELLSEVSQIFNAYWSVSGGALHIKDLSRWQNLLTSGLAVPFQLGSVGAEYGQAQLARVELSFVNMMGSSRPAPARVHDTLDYLNGGSDAKKIDSKFAMPYALGDDYIGATPTGVALIPKEIESNRFLMITDGEDQNLQRSPGAMWFLENYVTALHEIGTARGMVSVMDDPDLASAISEPYVRIAMKGLLGNVVCVKEATLNPHKEEVEVSAGIYSGLNG